MAVIATALAGLLGAALSWPVILLLVVLLLSATQLICIGILGQYLGRIYDEVRGRPLYIVSEVLAGRSGQHVARAQEESTPVAR